MPEKMVSHQKRRLSKVKKQTKKQQQQNTHTQTKQNKQKNSLPHQTTT